jgi:hypothetical protein
LHKYAYIHGDPVQGIDPTGLLTLTTTQVSIGSYSSLTAFSSATLFAAGATAVIGLTASVISANAQIQIVALPNIPPAIKNIVRNFVATAAAVEAVLTSIALSTTLAIETLASLQPFFVPKAVMPDIYELDTAALSANPLWHVLDYMANQPAARANRRAALRGRGSAGFLKSWDEFPFASTLQGGAASWVAAVPVLQNSIQGGYLGAFYRFQLRGPLPFLVVPIP